MSVTSMAFLSKPTLMYLLRRVSHVVLGPHKLSHDTQEVRDEQGKQQALTMGFRPRNHLDKQPQHAGDPARNITGYFLLHGQSHRVPAYNKAASRMLVQSAARAGLLASSSSTYESCKPIAPCKLPFASSIVIQDMLAGASSWDNLADQGSRQTMQSWCQTISGQSN